MPRARGVAVVLAVLCCGLLIVAVALRPARAPQGTEAGQGAPGGQAGGGQSGQAGQGGQRGSGSPATGRPSWQWRVGGPELASRGVVVHYPAGSRRRLPPVRASAYVIADAGTGQVLAAKDPHGEFPPASTLKVLTAITLIPLLNPNAQVVASRRSTSVEPNVVGLKRGRRYQVSSLFKALLMISANDAAVSLAEAAGSYHRAITLMNAEAHWLQAYDVAARDPNGLPAAHQHVSAYDEALIARRALAMPAFMRYDSTLAARFHVKRRKWVTLVNQNTLLMGYRGGIGGKIGWTDRARATYIGLARRHGVTLIVTLLHARPLTEITAGERLLNWGFAVDRKVRPVGRLVPPLAGGLAGQLASQKSGGG
jgi:D-alanyl-D-alanine carboxypeptidase (penicillin-binding protein 5/6)